MNFMNEMYKNILLESSKEELVSQLMRESEENCSHRAFLNQLEAGTSLMILQDIKTYLEEKGEIEKSEQLGIVISFLFNEISEHKRT
jgi:hypothetical protein